MAERQHHQRKLQPVTTTMCASGVLAADWQKENTTSARCNGQGARCKGQDQHQRKLVRDAATTFNYNHHHHHHWPGPTQHAAAITATCVRARNPYKPLRSCSDSCIMLCWSWLVVVDVVVLECCCCIPYWLALMLVLTLHLLSWLLHLALVVFSFCQPVKVLHLHTWWLSLAATCAGGLFPSAIYIYTVHTGGGKCVCEGGS